MANGERPKNKKFRKFKNYQEFEEEVRLKELSKYSVLIALVENLKTSLPERIKQFKEMVLNKQFSMSEADVVITTCHQAKGIKYIIFINFEGLEWNNVHVLNDFMELITGDRVDKNPGKEFSMHSWGDELNLWYVAVTRAKNCLKLPPRWYDLVKSIQEVLNKKEHSEFYGLTQDEEELCELFLSMDDSTLKLLLALDI